MSAPLIILLIFLAPTGLLLFSYKYGDSSPRDNIDFKWLYFEKRPEEREKLIETIFYFLLCLSIVVTVTKNMFRDESISDFLVTLTLLSACYRKAPKFIELFIYDIKSGHYKKDLGIFILAYSFRLLLFIMTYGMVVNFLKLHIV